MADQLADRALALRDRALSDLDLVLDGDRFADLLNQHRPELDVRGAVPTYVRYKPQTACLVAYRLLVGQQEVAAYVRLQHPDGRAKLAKGLSRTGAPGPLGEGPFELPGLTAMVYPRPNDRRILALPELVDPARRAALLQRIVPDHEDLWWAELHPLRWKPERRFVARLNGPGGATALVKAFGDGADPLAAIRAINGWTAPRTPRRLGRSHRQRIVVNEWLDGQALHELPSREGAALAGQALAQLHARSAPELRLRTRQAERDRLAASATTLAGLSPVLAARAKRLAAAIAEGLSDGYPVPSHGDFTMDQVLVDGSGTSLVDLDEACLADPLRDLGTFLAGLELDVVLGRLDAGRASELRAALLVGYGGVDMRALAAWWSAALLHLAPEPFRHRRPGWDAAIGRLVARAEDLFGGIDD